jgi:hypothetical protein
VFQNQRTMIQIIVAVILLCIFSSPMLAATYEKKESDYDHKTIYLRGYELVTKQGIHYQTNQKFLYEDGYLIYSETLAGTLRKAACLSGSELCDKWTKDPNSFKRYEGKRAKIKTDERLENNKLEEVIMDIRLLNK